MPKFFRMHILYQYFPFLGYFGLFLPIKFVLAGYLLINDTPSLTGCSSGTDA